MRSKPSQPLPPPSQAPVLLTTDEAAALLRVSPRTLHADRIRRRWQVPYLRIGRRILYDRDQVLRWLQEHQRQCATDSCMPGRAQ